MAESKIAQRAVTLLAKWGRMTYAIAPCDLYTMHCVCRMLRQHATAANRFHEWLMRHELHLRSLPVSFAQAHMEYNTSHLLRILFQSILHKQVAIAGNYPCALPLHSLNLKFFHPGDIDICCNKELTNEILGRFSVTVVEPLGCVIQSTRYNRYNSEDANEAQEKTTSLHEKMETWIKDVYPRRRQVNNINLDHDQNNLEDVLANPPLKVRQSQSSTLLLLAIVSVSWQVPCKTCFDKGVYLGFTFTVDGNCEACWKATGRESFKEEVQKSRKNLKQEMIDAPDQVAFFDAYSRAKAPGVSEAVIKRLTKQYRSTRETIHIGIASEQHSTTEGNRNVWNASSTGIDT